jgi:hypothetical protein
MGSIIEMVIVLAASAILTVVSIREDVAKRRSQVLSVEGQNESVIVAALGKWINENFQTLLAQYEQSGDPALTAPAIDQLHTAGDLKQAYRAGPFWGGSYVMQLSMAPAGCTADAGNCHVAWVFYPSLPYTRNGISDTGGAAQIALAASVNGGQFGYSSSRNPGTVSGINGAWTATNPLPGAPAAAILATNGPDGDGNSLFIRRDGSLTWTGSQNVNGVDLHNVGSIDATGTIAAPTVAASNVAVSNAVRSPGTLYVQSADGTATAPIDTGAAAIHGNAVVSGTLSVANVAAPHGGCSSPAGGTSLAANSDGSGQLLSCQGNQWMAIGGPWLRQGYTLAQNGDWIGVPACSAGGAPAAQATPQNFSVDDDGRVNFGVNGTGPWQVSITDGRGQPIAGAQVQVALYCVY